MASPTYKAKGIVLRKTRLGESDLIVELLDERGEKLKLVAKGARKPRGRLSAHLELFNTCEIMCVKGKNLDIVTESRLVSSRGNLMVDPLKNAASSAMAELLSSMIQVSLEQGKLFDMTEVAFDSLDRASEDASSLILVADMLKAVAFVGLRPMFSSCVICGNVEIASDEMDVDPSTLHVNNCDVRFSHIEGGLICANCSKELDTIWVPKSCIILAQRLLMSRFDDIEGMKVEDDVVFELLQFIQMWVGTHIGVRLKSLNYFINMCFLRAS